MRGDLVRVIGVFSGKGGVGKTTLSINLGAYMAAVMKKKVLVVDTNVTTPHVPLHLGIDHMPVTLNHVMKGQAGVQDAIYNHSSGLMVMPASLSMKDLKGIDMFELPSVIDKVHDKMFGKVDYVIMDAAPGFGREAMAAIRSCNEMLMVATPHTPSVMDIVRCKHAGEEEGVRILGTALNMVTGQRGELKKRDVEMISGTSVLSSIPYDRNMAKSLLSGRPIAIHMKRSGASRKIRELAEAII